MLRFLRSRQVLLIAFAFAVMGDPVSSVAYGIEAALRALDGHLELLLPTMVLVIAIIALVDVNYHHLLGRFPEGGGAAAAAGGAFGEAWAFVPMGALLAGAGVVVFTLGVNVSRVDPLASLGAAVGVGATLYGPWVRAGLPRGVARALGDAEASPQEPVGQSLP